MSKWADFLQKLSLFLHPGQVVYPDPFAASHLTSRQQQRCARSYSSLRQRQVPIYYLPLVVADDDEANLRSKAEIFSRLRGLREVTRFANEANRSEVLSQMELSGRLEDLTPVEREYILLEERDLQLDQDFTWRYESIWVLLWVLREVRSLSWPAGCCSVWRANRLAGRLLRDPERLRNLNLRPISEILDAQDLILKIHWAIRDSRNSSRGAVPDNLVWKNADDWTPFWLSQAANVVSERHYTLNWLVRYPEDQSWDDVDTPT